MSTRATMNGKPVFTDDAARVKLVSEVDWRWQGYAKGTFLAHAAFVPKGKLRFLQYVTKDTEHWWSARISSGAVLL